jgi:hypothetical protein
VTDPVAELQHAAKELKVCAETLRTLPGKYHEANRAQAAADRAFRVVGELCG